MTAQALNISSFFAKFIEAVNEPSSVSATEQRIDKRVLERVGKHLERVLRLCQNPRLNLKNSPPCISDIIPDISKLLRQVGTEISDPDALKYLNIFCDNIIKKCKCCNNLFKTSGSKIYEDASFRKSLTVLILRFSHMLAELKSLFPSGNFICDKFKITKSDAAEFWHLAFGKSIMVEWPEFQTQFSQRHPVRSSLESAALRTTIDITDDGWISIFEFDVFVRLFHPWNTILKNWNLLAISHPGYVAFLTYDEVKERLQQYIDKPGSYVFRQSCTRLGQWAIGYVTETHQILQTIPQSRSLIQALIDGGKEGFYKYPDGREITIDMSAALCTSPRAHIDVTEEQYELYCEMGSAFEVCKICSENMKDVCIEPCGHLLCSGCLKAWLDKNAQTCPFCRDQIKGQHPVEIAKFTKPENSKNRNNGNYDRLRIDNKELQDESQEIDPYEDYLTSATAQENIFEDDIHLSDREDFMTNDAVPEGNRIKENDAKNPFDETVIRDREHFSSAAVSTMEHMIETLANEGFDRNKAHLALQLANSDLALARSLLVFIKNYVKSTVF